MNAPGAEPWADFRIAQPAACLALLRELRDGLVPVVLNLPDGSALPTVLRAVDQAGRRLVFSADTSTTTLDRLVETNEALAVAYHQAVKVQFDLQGFVVVNAVLTRSLQCALPTEIFRFQRRNAFRVRKATAPDPVARFRHPALPDMPLALRMLDVSIGGCALWLPADVPPLQPGTHLGAVHVELDADTHFAVPASLQHVTAIGSSQGDGSGVRIGCAWTHLPGPSERLLQRWIDRTQQRHRLLQKGAKAP